MIKASDNDPSVKAVGIKDKFWKKGDTIRIKFLTGGGYSPELENYVKEYASTWLRYANLYFQYVAENEEADVKIGFDMDERWVTWATIGKDCQSVPQNAPSINFYGLDSYDDVADIRGDILRGFGHILGLIFEHQSPDSPIQFNAKAKNLLISNYGLSEADAGELMCFYNSDQTNYSEYDPSSIMVLGIYANMLIDKSEATPAFNTDFSSQDTTFVKQLYPRDIPLENTDSLAIVNINAINEHILSQGRDYGLRIGVNHDGDEKLPFVAADSYSQKYWYGYVSHGVVYRRECSNWIGLLGSSVCFIFKNELYVTFVEPTKPMEVKIYSLNNLEEISYFGDVPVTDRSWHVPYMYNGKRYITGGGMIENNILSLSVFDLDARQKHIHTIEFPLEDDNKICEMMFVKDNFIYFIVAKPVGGQGDIYKIKSGTFDTPIHIASTNDLKNAYAFIGNVNGSYYVGSWAWGKMFIIDPDDNLEWKNIPTNFVIFGYGNKLYKASFWQPTIPYYQEYVGTIQ